MTTPFTVVVCAGCGSAAASVLATLRAVAERYRSAR
jgi:hypothetical protein